MLTKLVQKYEKDHLHQSTAPSKLMQHLLDEMAPMKPKKLQIIRLGVEFLHSKMTFNKPTILINLSQVDLKIDGKKLGFGDPVRIENGVLNYNQRARICVVSL